MTNLQTIRYKQVESLLLLFQEKINEGMTPQEAIDYVLRILKEAMENNG